MTTVLGYALEEDEQILFFREHSYQKMKLLLILLGLVTLVFVVGIFLLVAAFLLEKKNPKAHVITTRRFLAFPYVGKPRVYELAWITDVDAERVKTRGSAIGSAIVAARQRAFNRKSKLEREYWTHAVGILLTLRQGECERVPCPVDGPLVGLALASILRGTVLTAAAE